MNSMVGYGGPQATGSMSGNKIPKGYKSGQMQQFTPEQMQLFQQLFSNVSPDSYLSKLAGGDQSLFEEMEAPAMRQFQGLQGGLASRFSGMGLGGRHSSGFQNTSTQAASDFAQNLQSQRQGLQMDAIKQLMGMSSDLLGQRPYEQFLVQKQQKSPLGGWGGALGAGLGGLAGFLSPMPGGAMAGAKLGASVLGGF